ncbi:8444_t:CDS:2, partial [Ambispora leptoticha]
RHSINGIISSTMGLLKLENEKTNTTLLLMLVNEEMLLNAGVNESLSLSLTLNFLDDVPGIQITKPSAGEVYYPGDKIVIEFTKDDSIKSVSVIELAYGFAG